MEIENAITLGEFPGAYFFTPESVEKYRDYV